MAQGRDGWVEAGLVEPQSLGPLEEAEMAIYFVTSLWVRLSGTALAYSLEEVRGPEFSQTLWLFWRKSCLES